MPMATEVLKLLGLLLCSKLFENKMKDWLIAGVVEEDERDEDRSENKSIERILEEVAEELDDILRREQQLLDPLEQSKIQEKSADLKVDILRYSRNQGLA